MRFFAASFLLAASVSVSALAPGQQTRREHFGDVMVGNLGIAAAATASMAAPANAAEFSAKTLMKIGQVFPGAIPNDELVTKTSALLATRGFDKSTTLVASSLCSDEVNRPLEDVYLKYYGNTFAMGGLAGFPFSGITGFGAMASHIPDGGNCLLVYGPHVGVSADAQVGKVNRRGVSKPSTCCGSAVGATKYLQSIVSGEGDILPPPSTALDAQQMFVSNMLLPYASEILEADDPMVTLPYMTFKPIDNMMNRIVAKASSKVGEKGRIAMLGGIQVCLNDCGRYGICCLFNSFLTRTCRFH